jgi:hypothetical protein
MRNKFLGTIAAVAAGAGGALAQMPARTAAPTPIAQVGAFDAGKGESGLMPANLNVAVPPPLPGMDGPPAGFDPGMADMGGPGYPPPGIYGQPGFQDPELSGVFSGINPAPRLYVDGSYLLLFPEAQPSFYPLLTTGAPAVGEQGRPSASTTTTLAGGSGLGLGTASGFRINAGLWRPTDGRLGVEIGGLYVAPLSNNTFVRSSDLGVPLIARPFVDARNGTEQVLLVSSPAFARGEASVRATTTFWGIEANGLLNVYRTCDDPCRSWSLNLLAGYRFIEFSEAIRVSSRSTLLPGRTSPFAGTVVAAPTTIEVHDLFEALNKFHGGQVGVQSQFSSGRWFVGVTGKAAFGVTSTRQTVEGQSIATNTTTGFGAQSLGGLFATASNIGRYKQDQFAIFTDVNVSLGYNFTRWFTATVGYNYMHLSAVARPGTAITGRTDPTLLPTSALYGTGGGAPQAFNNRVDDFWLHGLNFGFVVRY